MKGIESKYVLHQIIDNINVWVSFVDSQNNMILWNKGAEKITGYSAKEVIGNLKIYQWLFPDNGYRNAIRQKIGAILRGKESDQLQFYIQTKKQQKKTISFHIKTIYNSNNNIEGYLTIGREISLKKDIQESEIAHIEEKEIIIKDIHHRIKNNMQVMISLINLQTQFISDDLNKELFRNTQMRIKTMGMVHEVVYSSRNFESMSLKDFVLQYIYETTQNYNNERINVRSSCVPIAIPIENAVSVGLIINEIFTNALKHAFPENRHGEISIECLKENNNTLIIISDNGIGMPSNINLDNPQTLGLQLINLLSDQINADVSYNNNNGVTCTISIHEA